MGPSKAKKKKASNWNTPTVLSLVLGLIALIELRPQLSVNSQELLTPTQPFSAPFEITNTGLLGIHVDNVIVVYHQIELPGHTTYIIADFYSGSKDWDDFDLDSGGGTKTIETKFVNGTPSKADIVIAVDYVYLYTKHRKRFRFVGSYMDKWHWDKQPIGGLASSIDSLVDQGLAQHRIALALAAKDGR